MLSETNFYKAAISELWCGERLLIMYTIPLLARRTYCASEINVSAEVEYFLTLSLSDLDRVTTQLVYVCIQHGELAMSMQ